MIISLMVLHDKFGYGEKRLNKFLDEYQKQLEAYNSRFLTDYEEYAFCIRDAAGALIAGITAQRDLDCVRVGWLFVGESYRRQGYGSALLRRLEQAARQSGARRILLNTFSFQAPAFYAAQGYRLCAAIEPCFGAYGQYFFDKELPAAAAGAMAEEEGAEKWQR